ncbi:hypothetical protein WOLCODRAFT_145976 [Wolfiporia cocos MD-104 SS10]|uniref:SWIM-type domain-containing protein n=1 Tax=Wolfiporia cocos (strain MD-104) TaxID=742152 RepID=A0A2H3JAP2_WOLCO|nr:hypothetical protein WOLCODRAFT_145976 [Wolfiporia cocos MD-104 SS10]
MPKLLHLCAAEPDGQTLDGKITTIPEGSTPQTSVEPQPQGRRAKVNIGALYCNKDQNDALRALYEQQQHFTAMYTPSPESQQQAVSLLNEWRLDEVSSEMLERKWKVVWSQTVCGYDTQARQKREKPHNPTDTTTSTSTSASKPEWSRRAAYEFVECLAHIDITRVRGAGTISRIMGYPHHNDACNKTLMTRFPLIPLHPHVIEVALNQLLQGQRLTTIQHRNLNMLKSQSYRGQHDVDPRRANFRYEILPADFSGLYRQHLRSAFAIDIKVAPELNVDNWLDPTSPHYKPKLHEAVFHYQGRADQGDRFELCFSTPEMAAAAWKFIHGKQLVLDGTFGISTSRLLLWISMGIDNSGHGIPVALFLFSAPTGNRATHAGYDTRILVKLLGAWKKSLGSNAQDEEFEPTAALTDTDTKERGALLNIWPRIILLLCRFHVRQCWTNKRTSLLGKQANIWSTDVQKRLLSLETALLQTTNHPLALSLVGGVKRDLEAMARDSGGQKASRAGLSFICYLEDNWMMPELWYSWSQKGRNDAALRMQHRMLNGFYMWRNDRFLSASGGIQIPYLPSPNKSSHAEPQSLALHTLRVWYEPDLRRDASAQALFDSQFIQPVQSHCPYELWATCFTTQSVAGDPNRARYWLTAHPSGTATCTCPDWLFRGGACKHLRAFRMVITAWMTNGQLPHSFRFPVTAAEAEQIENENRRWYGPNYDMLVTKPISEPYKLPEPPARAADANTGSSGALPPRNVEAIPIEHELDIPVLVERTGSPAQELHTVDPISDKADDGEIYISNEPMPLASLPSPDPTDSIATTTATAVTFQRQRRIEHDVEKILPVLHGILSHVQDINSHFEMTANLSEFRDTIASLSDILGRASDQVGQDNQYITSPAVPNGE